MFKKRLTGLLRLFRFELPFTAGVCVVLGEILALGKIPSTSAIVLGFLSVFFISATSLILNDYFDYEIDKINAPTRPLPSGQVTKSDVVVLSIIVTLLGFICGYLISLAALAVLGLVWLVGFLYNGRFKKTGLFGNLMVSFSVSMTFIYGGIVVGKPFEKVVWFFALIVFLVDLGEEIAADALDLAGDRQAGSRSLAVRYGPENALKISGAIFCLMIIASLLPFMLGWLEKVYLLPLFLMDLTVLYSLSKLLDRKTENRRKYIRWIYLSGLAALLMMIIIRWFEMKI
jgi:geranylgeranylglycerol-phosphate geranylgeranyltransferase